MKPAVFLDRDGTIIEEVGYLDRARPRRALSVDHRRDPRAESGRPPRGGGDRISRASRAASSTRRWSTRRTAHRGAARGGRRAPRRVLLLSAPSATARWRRYARACDCRKPARGLSIARSRTSASIRRGRSWSATVARRGSSARAVGARGILVRTGYGAVEERRPPAGLSRRRDRGQSGRRRELDSANRSRNLQSAIRDLQSRDPQC